MHSGLFFLATIIQMSLLTPISLYASKGDNRAEFLSLCELIKIAKYFATGKPVFVEPAPLTRLDDIIGNVSLVRGMLEGTVLGNQSLRLQSRVEVRGTNYTNSLARTHRTAALLKVTRILRQLEGDRERGNNGIKSEVSKAVQRVDELVKENQKEAKKALYGDGGVLSENSGQTFADAVANAAHTVAGLSLANDVVALCPTQTTNECVDSSSGPTIGATTFTTYSHGKTLFEELMTKECSGSLNQMPSPSSIQIALDRFRLHLGTNTGTTYGSSGAYQLTQAAILGKRSTGNTNLCGNGNACVDYKAVISSPTGIKWLNALIKIQTNLVESNREVEAIKNGLQRAGDLEDAAIQELQTLETYDSAPLSSREPEMPGKSSSNTKGDSQDSPVVNEKTLSSQSASSMKASQHLPALSVGFFLI